MIFIIPGGITDSFAACIYDYYDACNKLSWAAMPEAVSLAQACCLPSHCTFFWFILTLYKSPTAKERYTYVSSLDPKVNLRMASPSRNLSFSVGESSPFSALMEFNSWYMTLWRSWLLKNSLPFSMPLKAEPWARGTSLSLKIPQLQLLLLLLLLLLGNRKKPLSLYLVQCELFGSPTVFILDRLRHLQLLKPLQISGKEIWHSGRIV